MNLFFLCFAPYPSTLVVKNTDILVGLQPPPVSLAALGFIHMMAEGFRSFRIGKIFPLSILKVTLYLTPDLSCGVPYCQKVLWIEGIPIHRHHLALMTSEIPHHQDQSDHICVTCQILPGSNHWFPSWLASLVISYKEMCFSSE